MLNAGEDFADGVIELEGKWLGGELLFDSTNKPCRCSGCKESKPASYDTRAFNESTGVFDKVLLRCEC